MKRNLQKLSKIPQGDYGWNFAIVNGKLAEIHFNLSTLKKVKRIYVWGHCYVKREEFKTKREQKMIDCDIQKNRLTWRNRTYKAVRGYAISSILKT